MSDRYGKMGEEGGIRDEFPQKCESATETTMHEVRSKSAAQSPANNSQESMTLANSLDTDFTPAIIHVKLVTCNYFVRTTCKMYTYRRTLKLLLR